jgi:hypothetical protein
VYWSPVCLLCIPFSVHCFERFYPHDVITEDTSKYFSPECDAYL